MASPPEEGGLKDARAADNNIVISDSTLRKILPPQLNKMTSRYKVMCGCELHILQNYALLSVDMECLLSEKNQI